MNIEKTKLKLSVLTDTNLDVLHGLIKKEYINRGRVDSNNNVVKNYTSNTTDSPTEQCASLSKMFNQAWIHG